MPAGNVEASLRRRTTPTTHSPTRAQGACGVLTRVTVRRSWFNRCMRIAVIAPPWAPIPPTLYGGIELVVDRLAVGFQDAGHEVLLYTTGDSTSPVPMAWHLDRSEGTRIGMVVPELRHVMAAYDAIQAF